MDWWYPLGFFGLPALSLVLDALLPAVAPRWASRLAVWPLRRHGRRVHLPGAVVDRARSRDEGGGYRDNVRGSVDPTRVPWPARVDLGDAVGELDEDRVSFLLRARPWFRWLGIVRVDGEVAEDSVYLSVRSFRTAWLALILFVVGELLVGLDWETVLMSALLIVTTRPLGRSRRKHVEEALDTIASRLKKSVPVPSVPVVRVASGEDDATEPMDGAVVEERPIEEAQYRAG